LFYLVCDESTVTDFCSPMWDPKASRQEAGMYVDCRVVLILIQGCSTWLQFLIHTTTVHSRGRGYCLSIHPIQLGRQHWRSEAKLDGDVA
jgi:hypothetical protein